VTVPHAPQPGWQPPNGGYPPPGPGPQQQAGFPQQQAGWPQPQAGFPQQQGGWPQPQAGQQAPYPGGYPAPQGHVPGQHGGYPPPPPVTKRIPEDLPFVVRPNALKRSLIVGAFLAVFVLPLLFCSGVLVSATDGEAVQPLIVPMLVLIIVVASLGVQIWMVASGGPVLALSPAGLWIKSRPTRGQAIWLPWEGVAHISRRRWSAEKMLVVKARDPRADSNLGGYTAVDASILKLFYGSGFTATLNFADKPEAEIMAAVQHFSAGRCPITW